MPQLTIQEALRYFFAPFVVFFYLAIYDTDAAEKLQNKFGTVGVVAFLVFGCILYFLYRYLVWDYLIMWLLHKAGWSYTNFFAETYEFKRGSHWTPASTKRAYQLFLQLTYQDKSPLQQPWFRLRAAGIHLLFQASILALPFLLVAVWNGYCALAFLFALLSAGLFLVAFLMNGDHQAEEIILIKTLDPADIDRAATALGIPKKQARPSQQS